MSYRRRPHTHSVAEGHSRKPPTNPLSGNRLQRLRALCPQIGVFGAAGGGVIIDGALDVGKLVPHLVETTHITGAAAATSAFSGTQVESYTRRDDAVLHDFQPVLTAAGDDDQWPELSFDKVGAPVVTARASRQMLYTVETFPAGTRFTTWMRLRRPSPLELAFWVDVLETFTAAACLGGRVAVGHGLVHVDVRPESALPDLVDWRFVLRSRRDDVLSALRTLT